MSLRPRLLIRELQVRLQSAQNGAGLKAMVKSLKGDAESTAIAQVLEGVGWNRKAAANDLQISYKALLYKIKQYDLSPRTRVATMKDDAESASSYRVGSSL